MKRNFTAEIDGYFERLKQTIDRVSRAEVDAFMNLLLDALERGSRIYIMGNGGSAATASHYAADFNKGLSYGKARRFRVHCLNDNHPTVSAYANDVSYEDVFVEQLRNFLEEGDLVIGISGSGNSRNVLKAIDYANGNGAVTVGLTGYDGGRLKRAAGHSVRIPVDDMQITEDLHLVLDHLIYAVFAAFLPPEGPEPSHGRA
ncbi:MAG TPA: SIS domain-containing protein [Rectinemataceae bacterium]|nr:SIS domain-containing protein [Rectinemataceae bacterium]